MRYWLLKADPGAYGFADLERERRAVWDGVSNPVALKNMREVRKGDAALVYHTGDEKAVVGLARVVSDPSPDPANARLVVFALEPVKRLASPVSLAAVKADPRFQDFPLVRQPRLSVLPVPPDLWKLLMRMAGEKV
ncbi:MAG TPA: EVE domain-containing protein [Candidatus Krumholzibacteria bacterium]|nr:EVE domain-containing protein [Candidatus Krumholzibacteria bacterium]